MAFDGKMFMQNFGKALVQKGIGQKSGPDIQSQFFDMLKKKKMQQSSGVDYSPELENAKKVEQVVAPGLKSVEMKDLNQTTMDDEEELKNKRKSYFA